MSHLGRGIDELEVDSLSGGSEFSVVDLVSEDEWSLLDSDATSLDHNVVLLDFTVVRESSEWGDVLLGEIVLGGSVVGNSS